MGHRVVEIPPRRHGEQLQIDRQVVELLRSQLRFLRGAAVLRGRAFLLVRQAAFLAMDHAGDAHVVERRTGGLGAQASLVGLEREAAEHALAGLRVGDVVRLAGNAVRVVLLPLGVRQQRAVGDRFEQAAAMHRRRAARFDHGIRRQRPVREIADAEVRLAQAPGFAIRENAGHLLPVDVTLALGRYTGQRAIVQLVVVAIGRLPATLAVRYREAQEHPHHLAAANIRPLDAPVAEVAFSAAAGIEQRAKPAPPPAAVGLDLRGSLTVSGDKGLVEDAVAGFEDRLVLPRQVVRRLTERHEAFVEDGKVAAGQRARIGLRVPAHVAIAIAIAPGMVDRPPGVAETGASRGEGGEVEGKVRFSCVLHRSWKFSVRCEQARVLGEREYVVDGGNRLVVLRGDGADGQVDVARSQGVAADNYKTGVVLLRDCQRVS